MGAVRLFLALVVASGHWQMVGPQPLAIDGRVRLGFSGSDAVFCFYVISGFLITYTLSRNYSPDLAGARRFWANRWIRIFALYWPVAAVALVVFPGARPTAWPDLLTGTFLLGADWRLAFASYPADHWDALLPGLHQAWTLGAELTFYAAAPLLMRSWRLAGAVLAASLAVRGWFVWRLGPEIHETWTYYFAPATFCFFLIGHFACRLGDAQAWARRPALAYAMLAASALVMTVGTSRALDSPRVWIAVLCLAAALPGLFAATKDSRILNLLGDLSYPVYLTHALAFVLLGGAIASVTAGMSGNLVAYLSILAGLACATAIAALLLPLERAIARRWRAALGRRVRTSAGADLASPASSR